MPYSNELSARCDPDPISLRKYFDIALSANSFIDFAYSLKYNSKYNSIIITLDENFCAWSLKELIILGIGSLWRRNFSYSVIT